MEEELYGHMICHELPGREFHKESQPASSKITPASSEIMSPHENVFQPRNHPRSFRLQTHLAPTNARGLSAFLLARSAFEFAAHARALLPVTWASVLFGFVLIQIRIL